MGEGVSGEAETVEAVVPGTIRLMTDEPLPVSAGRPAVIERAAIMLNRRPWLVPAALVAAGVAYLLLRRRR